MEAAPACILLHTGTVVRKNVKANADSVFFSSFD
jgi:hypothetical protein